MKFYILAAGLVFAVAVVISYVYDHLAVRRANRRERKKLLAQLTSQPPVPVDFSTPEGAVLCLEAAFQQKNLEAAVAGRDFPTEARLWLQERAQLSQEHKIAMLPETIRAMEKSFRDALAKDLPADWILGKSYFLPPEPFADGIVAVNKYTLVPEGGLYAQQILVAKTGNEWRTVKTLPPPLDNEA
jgi:hypothetical protein